MNRKPILSLTDHRRIVNWWIRFEDLNWPNHDAHDAIRRRAEKAAEANVTTAILFGCHFRWDYLPYFTLLHDYIATVAEELHKYNIELFDRHSVNLIHRYDTVEEMRHVMLHSGPHIPFSPSREAAASWVYKGKRLNNWRMLDVRTREPLYYPQYAGEGFCFRNPDFIEAYCDYAKRLVADTGIDGLAAEDSVHYMHFASCGCEHCRAELKKRSGIDLPSYEDRDFWGNWENPAWNHWIDLRYDAGKEFFEKLMPCLPKDFPVATCGINSASYIAIGQASDAGNFAAGGSTYGHAELSGNTPPYPNDPVTVNVPISSRMVGFSYQGAVDRKYGLRSFSTGYGFTEPSANIIWALNKVLDTDCCFSTLKARLGLPDHVLRELPEEVDVIGNAYGFEKRHPELFEGEQIGQLGVYYSTKMRDHTLFGNMAKGYFGDYSMTLTILFQAGISAHTVFSFPESKEQYPLIIVPSVSVLDEEQILALRSYIGKGGKVIVTGPSNLPECGNTWVLPQTPELDCPEAFFDTIAYGVSHKHAPWKTDASIPPCTEPNVWKEVAPGLFYNPHRVFDGEVSKELISMAKEFAMPLPIQVFQSDGYLVTMFSNREGVTVHLLAADYDVDIDHQLDDMRFHRSRVNYVNKVAPVGVTRRIRGISSHLPKVYTPFSDAPAEVMKEGEGFTVSLAEDTAYVILRFEK